LNRSDVYLGIDTSGETFSLALLRGERLLGEITGGTPRQHLVQLFPALDSLCRQSDFQLQQLRGVAVTRGPGSFTGVRSGLLVARTLAQSLGCELFPVDTLEALACNALEGSAVVPALDARKGQICWAQYRVCWGQPVLLEPARLSSAEEFVSALPAQARVLGSACQSYRAALEQAGVTQLPESTWPVRATQVARLAVLGLAAPVRWQRTRPEYVRPADVQVHSS
jgi:tRNA threonylcarbamoyladenosine biosynthesis protein TsaB